MAQKKTTRKWNQLNQQIVGCTRCERLILYCQHVAETKRKSFQDSEYWGQPVPNLGDSSAKILIVGLAPAAHGANRTGRMFTGDRSGDFLFDAMHDVGLCNQAASVDAEDGLKLNGCAITAICHCAPPANKPQPNELRNCRSWLEATVDLLDVRVFLALGQMAWNSIIQLAFDHQWIADKKNKFGHGAEIVFENGLRMLGCYHPSQQNTFTGRLTKPMMTSVLKKVIKRAT